MTILRPMLAGKCTDIHKLKFPVLATPKLDGIRCLMVEIDGKVRAMSRNFKPIPNKHVREWLEEACPPGFDGELVVPNGTFQDTSSAIMSRSGEPEFEYQVFDWMWEDPGEWYGMRMTRLRRGWEQDCQDSNIRLVLPVPVKGVDELEEYEVDCLQLGYEGVMVRSSTSPYKFGRSTEREGYLLKIKRFVDGEATIIGFEEKTHNANEARKDELGRTKRSSHKANQEPMGTLGALKVKDLKTGIEFKIGSGFDDALRAKIWKRRESLRKKIVKYKFQSTGILEKPRFPVFLGLRSALDEF